MTISELGRYQYHVAGCLIESSIPFPELTLWEPVQGRGTVVPDLRFVVWQSRGEETASGAVPAFLQAQSCYVVQSTTGCSFTFDATTGTVWATRPRSVKAQTLREAFLSDVLPLCLAALGHLLLHASGVALAGEQAVVFAGQSGSGKSTLAAYFGLSGACVMADDFVRIVPGETNLLQPTAYSTFSRLQLFRDSLESLSLPDVQQEEASAPVDATRKRGIDVGSRFLAESAAFPLTAVFILQPSEDATAPRIERLGQTDGFLEIVKGAFIFDSSAHEDAVLQFQAATAVAQQLAVYRLTVPRNYEQLPAVYHAVCEFVAVHDYRGVSGLPGSEGPDKGSDSLANPGGGEN